MAKRPHKVFEIYGSRDEALERLESKSAERLKPAASIVEDSWSFEHLSVSQVAHAVVVEFRAPQAFSAERVIEFRHDFSHLANKVDAETKMLLDFTGVKSFPDELVAMLTQFYENLRHKGTRLVLCCLGAETRETFFPVRTP